MVFIVNAPTTFTAIWTVMKQLMDENMLAKISINSGNTNPQMLELIAPE